jgi:Leucine-rich repeat (LRR) protein
VGDLEALVSLYLTDNKLVALPATLGRLRCLRKLQAASNALKALPAELADAPELVRA